MPDTTPTTAPDLTKEQCEERRQRALHLIESELRATLDSWHQTPPRLDWAAAIALDALGDLAAEILVDGTMMRSLTIRDGVATLELAEATELVRVFAAGMRGVLNGHGASNYVEMELTDGATGEGFTVTVQRRECPTPHQFRQRAEARVAELEAEVARLVLGTTDQQPETAPACPQCGNAGACNGGPCPLTQTAPADLRDRVAQALIDWAYRSNDRKYTALRRDETVRANAYSRADAVLAVLPAPTDRATDGDEAAILALSLAGAFCGECGFEPGDRGCADCERSWAGYVKALRAAGWGPNRMADEAQHPETEAAAPDADRIVAYRDPHNPRVLLCREHGEKWQGVYPVASEDLPDGGICTFGRLSSLTCGRDVLAP